MTPPDGHAERSVRPLVDGFGRIRQSVHTVVEGLDTDQLAWRPDGTGNSIGWLLGTSPGSRTTTSPTRSGDEQTWTAAGLGGALRAAVRRRCDRVRTRLGRRRRGAPPSPAACWPATTTTCTSRTVRLLESWDDAAFGRIVDDRRDPPVTLSVRLVSVLADNLKHAGQAEYVRGLLPRD